MPFFFLIACMYKCTHFITFAYIQKCQFFVSPLPILRNWCIPHTCFYVHAALDVNEDIQIISTPKQAEKLQVLPPPLLPFFFLISHSEIGMQTADTLCCHQKLYKQVHWYESVLTIVSIPLDKQSHMQFLFDFRLKIVHWQVYLRFIQGP